MSTARIIPLRCAADAQPQVAGIEVTEISPAEYMEAMNGRAVLDVPHVAGEHHVAMRGTVPADWSLA